MNNDEQSAQSEQNRDCWAKPFSEGSPLDQTIQRAILDAAGRPTDMLSADAVPPDMVPALKVPHVEPTTDAEAAAHGAKKFQACFADAEIQRQLDRLAAPRSLWCVTIHSVIPGDTGDDGRPILRHWMKRSDAMPYDDLAKCAAGVADMAAKSIPLEEIGNLIRAVTERATAVFRERQKAAEVGIFGAANAAPSTFADEED